MAPTRMQRSAAILGLALIQHYNNKKCQKRKRMLWVNSFLMKRDHFCIEHVLLKDLLTADSEKYTNFLRLSHDQFLELHEKVKTSISCQNTQMRDAILSEVKLALTLRYLATGDSHKSLEFISRVSRVTISKMIPLVCNAIYNALEASELKVPTDRQGWESISNDFNELWQFPHTIGALDGKHIAITAPPHQGSLYFNYKGFHSIVLLALVDAHCKFIYIDVGCNGRISDGGVYKNSTLYKKLKMDNSLNVPPGCPLPGMETSIPYFIIGDDAFSLDATLMKPYPRSKQLTVKQRVYNYRLSRARRVVENAFGLLSNRFRIFKRPMEVNLSTTESIVKTCCVLHNYLRNAKITCNTIAAEAFNQFAPLQQEGSNFSSNYARTIRDSLANYFVSEGEQNFQWNYI